MHISAIIHEFVFYVDFQIVEQPQENLIVDYDESISLRMSAVGSGQLSYEWKKDELEITDRDHYTGINTAALTISSFSDKCQGDYLCIVKNDNVTIESKHAKVELSKSVLTYFSEYIILAIFYCLILHRATDYRAPKTEQKHCVW
jgi:hypothetical protein